MHNLEAKIIATHLMNILKPYCKRIEIAGSIRREKELVNDIEIVLIPENANKLFTVLGNELMKANHTLKPEYRKNGNKYKQFMYDGAKVDLFTATEINWGYIFAIRTGSAEFSHNVLATGWVENGYKGVDGNLTKDGVIVPVREEIDLFDLINVNYTEPKNRI